MDTLYSLIIIPIFTSKLFIFIVLPVMAAVVAIVVLYLPNFRSILKTALMIPNQDRSFRTEVNRMLVDIGKNRLFKLKSLTFKPVAANFIVISIFICCWYRYYAINLDSPLPYKLEPVIENAVIVFTPALILFVTWLIGLKSEPIQKGAGLLGFLMLVFHLWWVAIDGWPTEADPYDIMIFMEYMLLHFFVFAFLLLLFTISSCYLITTAQKKWSSWRGRG